MGNHYQPSESGRARKLTPTNARGGGPAWQYCVVNIFFGLVPSELDHKKRTVPKMLWAKSNLATQCNERARKLTPTIIREEFAPTGH